MGSKDWDCKFNEWFGTKDSVEEGLELKVMWDEGLGFRLGAADCLE